MIEKKKWSEQAHEVWQIDGKEQIGLANGEEVSWMNIADEGTSAHLKAFVCEASTVTQMDAQAVTQQINTCFERWGLPKQIKIDNGLPFVYPRARDVPTLTKLWWIGLGIKVIQNAPRCPQQNGIVECSQGIMCNWSNPKDALNAQTLQQRLDEESDFQRNYYKMPNKKLKTRIELHPDLEHNPRIYAAKNFDMQRVYDYLSNKVFKRTINNAGVLSFWNINIYIGKKFAQLPLTITFDPIEMQWLLRKKDGTLMKTLKKGIPSEKQIKEFAVMSMN